jgi:hypothetical protein
MQSEFRKETQRTVKRLGSFFTWVFSTGDAGEGSVPWTERRLLVIYDLATQPFSIGDIIVIQEASLVLREKHGLDSVDFALVYDPIRPALSDPAFARITKKNVLYHLAGILPVAQVNQHLGSLFVFNSHAHLLRFISDNSRLYRVWPSAMKFATKDYLNYEVFNNLLFNFYNEHGSIPLLTCRKYLVDWARTFYREHVYPLFPVTVNLRNNKFFGLARNSRMECWLEFFHDCEERYPVRFVIVCAIAEVDERMRHCPNVVIAKDFHTGIEEDLALIHTSEIHMGASSGPISMAIFNDKPYLMVNWDADPRDYRGLVEDGDFLRFCFAGPLQRLTKERETTSLLLREFAEMWASIGLSHRTESAKH